MFETFYFLIINKVKKKILYRSCIKYSLSYINKVDIYRCFRR